MIISIAICDDDKLFTGSIELLLMNLAKKYSMTVETEVYYKGEDLVKDIKKGIKYDIIYLDIEMENVNGVVAARYIREIDLDVILIYISNYEKYLRELFEVNTYRFLDKPINEDTFERYFLGAIDNINKKCSYFTYKFNREYKKVKISEITYFESNKRFIQIHTVYNDVHHKFYHKLSDIEEYFSTTKFVFIRIHQSFLVNAEFVKGFKQTTIELENGIKLPISEDRQKKVIAEYSKVLGRELFDE